MINTGNIEEFSRYCDDLYSVQSRKLYRLIEQLGKTAFAREGPLYKYQKTDLLDNLMDYFVSTEEYEKSAYIKTIKEQLSN